MLGIRETGLDASAQEAKDRDSAQEYLRGHETLLSVLVLLLSRHCATQNFPLGIQPILLGTILTATPFNVQVVRACRDARIHIIQQLDFPCDRLPPLYLAQTSASLIDRAPAHYG